MFKKITAIVSLIIALAVIALGASLMSDDNSFSVKKTSYSYTPDYYDADYAAFGADFYTYVYEGVDIIVSELNDISHAVGTVVEAQNSINNAIAKGVDAVSSLCKIGGMIVVSIGLALLAYSLNSLAAAFESQPAVVPHYTPYPPTQYGASAQQPQSVYNPNKDN